MQHASVASTVTAHMLLLHCLWAKHSCTHNKINKYFLKAHIQKCVLRHATFESLESTIIFIAEWEHSIVHTTEYLKSYSTKFVENGVHLLKECSFSSTKLLFLCGVIENLRTYSIIAEQRLVKISQLCLAYLYE